MSAADNINPQQFGKLTIAHDPLRYRTVTATTPSGRNAGYLMWDKPAEHNANQPTINGVKVSKQFQGKGLAGAMLQHALQHEPGLKHSHALTPDGQKFAARYPL